MSIRLLALAQTEPEDAVAWYADQAPSLGNAFLLVTHAACLRYSQTRLHVVNFDNIICPLA